MLWSVCFGGGGGWTVSSYISLEAKLFTHVEIFPWNYSLASRLQLYSYLEDIHRIISMVEFLSCNRNNNWVIFECVDHHDENAISLQFPQIVQQLKCLGPSAETRIQWDKFSANIRCRNLLQILPIVLKLRSTAAVPRGQTRVIFETIEREEKASARSPPWEASFCNTSFAVGHSCFDASTFK